MSYSRPRRYGQNHIDARIDQIDALLARIADYGAEISGHREGLAAYRSASLWLDAALTDRADASLSATAAAVGGLEARTQAARDGFLGLPRLEQDRGEVPEAIVHEALDAA